jgi:phosphate transport system substrate-binding protein
VRVFVHSVILSLAAASAYGADSGGMHRASGVAAAEALPAYQAQPVALSKNAPFVLPDGSVYIVGNDAMEGMLNKLNALFVRTHPGFRFTMQLKGSSTGLGGITAGVSAFAPVARQARGYETRPFRETYGYDPTEVRVGYAGFSEVGRNNPPAVYVNINNPLAGLSVDQVARIFTTGGGAGDLTHWQQAGVAGDFGKRVIRPYGLRDDGGFASSMRLNKMDRFQFADNYEPFANAHEIMQAIAQDRYGIGLIDSVDVGTVPANVKLLPLATPDGTAPSLPTYENVRAGRYPFSPYIAFYINRAPGKPLDAFVKEYLRMALSREGQALIATERNTAEGYLPLDPALIAEQLSKLE